MTLLPHRRPVSLRLRLTAVFALAMALVLGGLAAFLHGWLAAELQREIDRALGAHADTLLADRAGPDLASTGRFVDPDEAFAQLIGAGGEVVAGTPGLGPTAVLMPAQTRAVSVSGPTFLTQHVATADADPRLADPEQDPDRLLATPVTVHGRPGVLVVGQTLSDRDEALAHQLRLFALALPVALLVTSAAGWLLAGAALRPVESMRRRAAERSAQDPAFRLPVPRTGDELARLAVTLNELLDRLHRSMEREHRFVDDASHELRSPLTVLKAELDLALSRPRPPAQLRDALQAAAVHTDELVRLAEDLLVLARMRGGGLPLHRVPTDLAELLDRAVDPVRPLAVARGRTVRVEAPGVRVRVDPLRIRQAVLNLVDNALRHGAGTVRVTATVTATALTIGVRDEGEGFPPELAASAFEPFVRGDGDMSPAGAGLGLAIVRAVALAHGGLARAVGAPGGGACVVLELPLAADDAEPETGLTPAGRPQAWSSAAGNRPWAPR